MTILLSATVGASSCVNVVFLVVTVADNVVMLDATAVSAVARAVCSAEIAAVLAAVVAAKAVRLAALAVLTPACVVTYDEKVPLFPSTSLDTDCTIVSWLFSVFSTR